MNTEMNTKNILICRFCVEVHSKVWRRVEYEEDKVWVCDLCWNTSLADIPDEVLEYDPPDYEESDDDEDEDEDEYGLCADCEYVLKNDYYNKGYRNMICDDCFNAYDEKIINK